MHILYVTGREANAERKRNEKQSGVYEAYFKSKWGIGVTPIVGLQMGKQYYREYV